jgi:hypothetical protein
MALSTFTARTRPAYPNTAAHTTRAPTHWWPEVVLALLAITTAIAPPGVATVLAFMFFAFPFFWWLGSGKPWPSELIGLIVPFVVMIVAGLAHGLSHPKFDIGKDVWYLGNGALMAGAAYVLVRVGGRFETIARPLIIAGFLAALLHLSRFALHPSILLKPATAIRMAAGFGYGISITALIMIAMAKSLRIRLFGPFDWITYPIGLVCAASFVLMFSRTGVVVLLLQLVLLTGWFDVSSPRRVLIFGAGVLLLLVTVATTPLPIPHGSGQSKFIDKVLRSFEEIRIDEYYVRNRIEANWRGYETARALRTYKDGRPDEWILGRGLGSTVDLGLGLELGAGPHGDRTRYAPVLHNGYLFVLVKSGLVGLAALMFWFSYVATIGARAAGSRIRSVVLSGRLIVATVFLMTLTNWTTSSVFPKSGLTAFLLLGALIALVTRREVKQTGHAAPASVLPAQGHTGASSGSGVLRPGDA